MQTEQRRLQFLLLGPPLFLIVILTTVPFLFLFRTSFSSWKLTIPGSNVFVGLQNYIELTRDDLFWQALKVNFFFAGGAVLAELVLGMVVALLLNRSFFGRRLARSVMLIPMMMTPAVVGLIWRTLYNPQFGIINYLLGLLNLPPQAWLADLRLALPSVILTDIWEWTPYVALMLLAGLQSLPKEPFDAAKVDGANSWQIFWYVTLPFLRPIIMIAASFRLVTAFRWFDTIFIMTAGGPAHATTNLNVYAYLAGFRFYKIGYASAMSVVVLMLVLFFTFFLLRYSGADIE